MKRKQDPNPGRSQCKDVKRASCNDRSYHRCKPLNSESNCSSGPGLRSATIAEEHPDLCHGKAYYQGVMDHANRSGSGERNIHSNAEHNQRTDARILSDLLFRLMSFSFLMIFIDTFYCVRFEFHVFFSRLSSMAIFIASITFDSAAFLASRMAFWMAVAFENRDRSAPSHLRREPPRLVRLDRANSSRLVKPA